MLIDKSEFLRTQYSGHSIGKRFQNELRKIIKKLVKIVHSDPINKNMIDSLDFF